MKHRRLKKAAFIVMVAVLFAGLPGCGGTPRWVRLDQSAVEHLKRGNELIELKQYAEAENEYDIAYDENGKAWEMAIQYDIKPTDWWELEDHFKKMSCVLVLNRGTARYFQGETAEALKDWEWVAEQGSVEGYRDYACLGQKKMAREKLDYIKGKAGQ